MACVGSSSSSACAALASGGSAPGSSAAPSPGGSEPLGADHRSLCWSDTSGPSGPAGPPPSCCHGGWSASSSALKPKACVGRSSPSPVSVDTSSMGSAVSSSTFGLIGNW
eukprot:CAMPEP_0179284138 /NCGR_PEP_ID=MMETSP0797-20121207/38534_1 /TAXON_ID=47934 /ORGANISM="Dinophysis acuminata, Strain DAEP01" /LENGTH=109 /DNA_ID=CAMNT_0020992907 /DNA_START=27 /DNA_END=353 /DNA_ORIENTATION=+